MNSKPWFLAACFIWFAPHLFPVYSSLGFTAFISTMVFFAKEVTHWFLNHLPHPRSTGWAKMELASNRESSSWQWGQKTQTAAKGELESCSFWIRGQRAPRPLDPQGQLEIVAFRTHCYLATKTDLNFLWEFQVPSTISLHCRWSAESRGLLSHCQ